MTTAKEDAGSKLAGTGTGGRDQNVRFGGRPPPTVAAAISFTISEKNQAAAATPAHRRQPADAAWPGTVTPGSCVSVRCPGREGRGSQGLKTLPPGPQPTATDTHQVQGPGGRPLPPLL